jgi:hypothetical protein
MWKANNPEDDVSDLFGIDPQSKRITPPLGLPRLLTRVVNKVEAVRSYRAFVTQAVLILVSDRARALVHRLASLRCATSSCQRDRNGPV